MRRQILEDHARMRELRDEGRILHERRRQDDPDVVGHGEQMTDEPGAQHVAGGSPVRDRDDHCVGRRGRDHQENENWYGSDTRPSSSSARLSTPLPRPLTAKRGPAVT